MHIQPTEATLGAAVTGVDLRQPLSDADFARIEDAWNQHAVLIFPGQHLSDEQHLAFTRRFGRLEISIRRTGSNLGRLSNVDKDGNVVPPTSLQARFLVGNTYWHSDSSYKRVGAKASLLAAHVVPSEGGETEWADMRAAYDALEPDVQTELGGLRAHHSIAYSRQILGFEFSEEEGARLEGAEQPLINQNPRTGRRALYLASHASRICGWPLADGRLLLRDLTEHATQPRFVHRHQWQPRDFVIWDNLATMHRARAFDDLKQRRELRRVTTLDVEFEPA